MPKAPVVHFTISGFADCPYYRRAVELAEKAHALHPETITFNKVELSREKFHEHRQKILVELGKSADSHKTCPLVYTTYRNQPRDYIGGCDDFTNFLKTEYNLEC